MEQQNSPSLRFFTVAEIAELLKMNQQVIARKLAAGEIEGYKIGKDWRITEAQLTAFLERHSNKRKTSQSSKVIDNFFTDGKLKSIPAARSKRLIILKFIVSKLDRNKVYTEKEINNFLSDFYTDICTLRRELIINKLMVRKDSKYKVVSWQS